MFVMRQKSLVQEAEVPEKLWFHGSKYDTADRLRLEPPSPDRIFFVADNIDYVLHYANENMDRKGNVSSVYACRVRTYRTGLRLYNRLEPEGKATDREFGFNCMYALNVLAAQHSRNPDDVLVQMISFVQDFCRPVIQAGYDFGRLIEENPDRYGDRYVWEGVIKELPNFLEKTGLTEAEVLTPNLGWDCGDKVRKALCRFWRKCGLNAYSTFETQDTGMASCLGIFDVSALDGICMTAIPMDVIRAQRTAGRGDSVIREYLANA